MSGEVEMMVINDGLTFWRVFEMQEASLVTYEQLYTIFLKEYEFFIMKNKLNSIVNFEQIRKQRPVLYQLSDTDVSSKKPILDLTSIVPINSEILVKIQLNSNDSNSSFLRKSRLFPTISESEASESVIKAKRVSCLSIRSELKFYKSASKYSLIQYVEALFKQKKYSKIYPFIETLKKKYPMNPQINFMIAKCYESRQENALAMQTYKEGLIFSDSLPLLVECSKLYMNSDRYLSLLLLNRSISCDSTNSEVIIRAMIDFLTNKKYNEAFNLAFRSKKSIVFLAKSLSKSEELSNYFIDFFRGSTISVKSFPTEIVSLISILYRNGAVFESLFVCHHIFKKCSDLAQKKSQENNLFSFLKFDSDESGNSLNSLASYSVDPFIARIYFTILLNEGLYKRFVEISKEFTANILSTNDYDALEVLGLRRFFDDYLVIISCKKRNDFISQDTQNIQDNIDVNDLTERQEAILDCICAMSSFLFLIGSCNEIGSFSCINANIIKVNANLPFWQLRLMFSILHPISDILPSINTSMQSVALIGDVSSIMTSYQMMTIIRQNKDSNENLPKKEKERKFNLKNSFLILPNIIIDICIWKLRKGNKNGQKKSFWSRIERLDEYPLVLIELGATDCEYKIPKLLHKNRFSTVGKAIDAITDIYIKVVFKVMKRLPKAIVAIHPVIPTNSLCSPLIHQFNKVMQCKATENHIRFLDVFAKYGPFEAIVDKSFAKYLASLRKWLFINEMSEH